ncbi:MAG: ThiF family adenylyltransferase [Candidatus Saccharimonadales bacterium]
MRDINSPEFHRNYGFWNEGEQQALLDAHVAIAGVGGDGYQLGLKLARMGVRNLTVADPEVFEPENSNRVPGATEKTYGTPKVEAFIHDVLEIDSGANITVFRDGVTEDNIEDFLKDATLCFDESELTHLQIGTGLAREARRRGIPNIMIMNVGFAAQGTSFHPNSKHTFERLMGVPDGMPLDEVKDMEVDFSRCLPYIPNYGDLRTLQSIQDGASLASIAQGVDVASAIGASEAFLHIVAGNGNHRRNPTWAPRIRWMDAMNNKSGVARFPRVSHYQHLGVAVARNLVGTFPKASYTQQDIERRTQAYEQSSK